MNGNVLRSPFRGPVGILGLLLFLALPVADDGWTLSAQERTETMSAAEEARLKEAARLRGLALAEMEEGNFGSAQQNLQKLTAILPDNILPPINLAICYYRLDRREDALEQIERARHLDPDNPQMLYTFARLLEHNPEDEDTWRAILAHFATTYPTDPRPHYLRALKAMGDGRYPDAVAAFELALDRDRDNLVLIIEALVAAAEARDLDAAADALDATEDRLDGFEGSVADFADKLRDLIDEEQEDGLRPPAHVLRNLLRPTDLYQLGLTPLTGGRGSSGALFPQLDFDPALPKSIQGGQDIQIAFVDASSDSRLDRVTSATFTSLDRGGDVDGLIELGTAGAWRLVFRDGAAESLGLALDPPPRGRLHSYDIDQDTLSDLVAMDSGLGVVLYRGDGSGGYRSGTAILPEDPAIELKEFFPVDLDHDGDLDIFVTRAAAADLYLQNNGDGSWTERGAELGLAGPSTTSMGIAVADFDEDGDLDLVVNHPAAHPRLYLNQRAGAFEDGSSKFGLDSVNTQASGIRTADFNNDGLFDLLLWGAEGGHLLVNLGTGFELQDLGPQIADWQAVAVGDFDNDSDQDVAFVPASSGELTLLRNRRSGFEIEPMSLAAESVQSLSAGDFDADGDLDLVARLADGSRRFWLNQGGNRNQWVKLRLRGLYDNNSKNNTQGLFARIETRVGDVIQTILGGGGSNHIGLGAARQADVIRVVWTNGLPQTWLQVASKQTLVEQQVLKGSCPFLYTWTGQGFSFLTDLMWKSTLGMQLDDGSRGTHSSARDFVLVPGEALVPSGGQLWLQTTAELWETVYVDHQVLWAVDHPVAVELVVDESFAPPPYSRNAPIHWLGRRLLPVLAKDHLESDVLTRLLERDGYYVDQLPLSRYQGLTRGHRLDLTFEEVPEGERLRLILWGWTFPTDSSINFALAQDRGRQLRPPRLEILQEDGSWDTLVPFIGFPNGKRKAVVVELPDGAPRGRITLRISTTMQIYWDAVWLAVGEPQTQPTITRLEVEAADLHYRGFSRLYRESPTGPHLFDYERVSIGSRFRDMNGRFTRYGSVEVLLAQEDDRYAIMNAGDELTVRFDATRLPPLPGGWRRDFVLYTDGWVKDADLHTAFSQTVEPLPYHGMSSYSATATAEFPTAADREFVGLYQTRRSSDQPFRDALRQSDAFLIHLQNLDLVQRP